MVPQSGANQNARNREETIHMRLINTSTGETIEPGATLRHTDGTAWRMEHIAVHRAEGHRVHCTRTHRRMGRVHREFHPSVFGCHVAMDPVKWWRDLHTVVHHALSKGNDYLLAGVFALLPLAFFEHYHWGEKILSAFSGGEH